MKKSKLFNRKIILLLLLLPTVIAHGQNKLFVYEKDGSSQSVRLADISKLTFTENQMQVDRKMEDAITFSIEEISYMNFQYIPINVSIPEKGIDNLKVYPNPVTSKLTVKNNEAIDDLRIFDLQGKLYLHISPKSEIVDIDMSSLPTGMYFIRIISNGKISTGKIVKSSNN